MKRRPEHEDEAFSKSVENNLNSENSGLAAATPARREFLRTSFLGATAIVSATTAVPLVAHGIERKAAESTAAEVPAFELDETTISELQDAMKSGKLTSRAITEKYLARIDQIDKQGPAINAIIELNPEALSIADSLDKERSAKGPRGPLHGVPMLIKDNIDTADKMMTTAGSLALLNSHASKDSTVAQRLRDAGAVILGKTNLSEWANIRSNHSTSGWSGRGGQTKNPYALDRNPCGSSSGSGAAVSANLAAAAIGTETDGSIVCPSSTCGIAGIKPTVGLVSRTGIIPISHSQDTAGPMCRTLRDAAIVLGALTGMDEADAATTESREHSYTDYTQFLKEDGLRGARIGVVRRTFGFNEAVDRIMENALEVMKNPATVFALVLLLVNDHVLKAAFPGLVTGKLSDVAGLVLAPPLVAVLLTLLVPRLPSRAAALAGLVAVGAGFARRQIQWVRRRTRLLGLDRAGRAVAGPGRSGPTCSPCRRSAWPGGVGRGHVAARCVNGPPGWSGCWWCCRRRCWRWPRPARSTTRTR